MTGAHSQSALIFIQFSLQISTHGSFCITGFDHQLEKSTSLHCKTSLHRKKLGLNSTHTGKVLTSSPWQWFVSKLKAL